MEIAKRLKYRILDVADAADVRDLLEKYFTSKAKLTQYLGIQNEDLQKTYYSRVEAFIEQGNSFGAFNESNQLVAFAINMKKDKDEERAYQTKLKSHEKIEAIERLMIFAGQDELPSILGTTEYWEMKMATVHPDYRHSGVVDELALRTIQLAKEKGIKKLVGFQTYEQPENNPLGLYVIRKIDLREYVDSVSGKKIFSGLKPPNHVHVIYGYTVDKEENQENSTKTSLKSRI